jgi:hypothetical protein
MYGCCSAHILANQLSYSILSPLRVFFLGIVMEATNKNSESHEKELSTSSNKESRIIK